MKLSLVPKKPGTGNTDFLDQGFSVIEMPVQPSEITDSFNDMPRDYHSLGRLRTIRLSQYFGYNEEGEWIFALLPKRHYIQSAKHIQLKEAGGVLRYREQLTIDPSSLIRCVLNNLPIDTSRQLQINVNQIRVTVNPEYKGITVPEGPHRDGHLFSIIAIASRHNVTGGETQIIDPHSREVLYTTTLAENQAILIDDERYIHNASNIEPIAGDTGYRDIWVIEVNYWEDRAYGPSHETRSATAL